MGTETKAGEASKSEPAIDLATVMAGRARWLKRYGLLAVVISGAAYAAAFAPAPLGNTSDWGAFGDFIGGIAGTVIAVLTLSAVADTLATQAQELKDARELIRAQSQLVERQAFDTTFFRLLEHFHDLAREPKIAQCAQDLNGSYITASEAAPRDLAYLRDSYDKQYKRREALLGPYFRTLFHLVKFVDSAHFVDRASYTSLVRAKLAPTDLLLLYVNVVARDEGAGLKPFVERYGLLKHSRHLDWKIIRDFRPVDGLAESAFQSRAEMALSSAG